MPTTETDTKHITNYLRGLGIVAVLLTHYMGLYDEDFYAHWLNNYANAFMALFFILAGYGAYHSFEARFAQGKSRPLVITRYYFDRAVRIYPLYWLGLIATAVFEPQYFPVTDLSPVHLIAMVLALPVLGQPLWFVVAILQCYLVAPPLYLLCRRLGLYRFIAFNTILIGAIWYISHHFSGPFTRFESWSQIDYFDPTLLLYRGVFMGNLLQFSLGMMIPMVVARYRRQVRCVAAYYISAVSLVIFSVVLRYDVIQYHRAMFLMEFLYYVCVFSFCLFTLTVMPYLPFGRVVALLGTNSYSIYLFHAAIFGMLMQVHLFWQPEPISLIAALAVLPPLIWLCIYTERAMIALHSRLLFACRAVRYKVSI